MLVTLRVPISDARGFSADSAIAESVVLPRGWVDGDFVRGVGRITRRPSGIVEPWSFEAAFANGKKLLTVPPDSVASFAHERRAVIEAVRKRAWQALEGSSALLDLDVAFQISPLTPQGVGANYWSYERTGSDVAGDVGFLAGLPVRIRARPDQPGATRRLITVGSQLAERYATATSTAPDSGRLVGAGRISAVVEAAGVTIADDFKDHHQAVELGRIRLTSLDLPVVGGGLVRCHILSSSSTSTGDRKRIRELRIHILRLHSIFELMRFLTSQAVSGASAGIAEKQGTQAYDRLQQTLLACARTVRTDMRPGRADADVLLDTAFFARRLVDADLRSMLTRVLTAARPRVRAEVEALLENESARNAMSEAERNPPPMVEVPSEPIADEQEPPRERDPGEEPGGSDPIETVARPWDLNDLSGPQRKVLRNALTKAFTRSDLDRMLQDNDPSKGLDILVSAGGLEHQVFELIATAQRQGWTDDLVRWARVAQPDHYLLTNLVDDLRLLDGMEKDDRLVNHSLEQTVKARSDTLDFTDWLLRFARLRGVVCRIEDVRDPRKALGTGFLVAADMLLTNFHVIEQYTGVAPAMDTSTLMFRFDYVLESQGENFGKVVSAAGDGWLVSSAAYSRNPGDGADLDYALIRVSSPVGNDMVGDVTRGFLQPSSLTPAPQQHEVIFIAQHPNGDPLKMAVGTVLDAPADGHLRYDTETQGGSSGSPCLDATLNLVGLHQGSNSDRPSEEPHNNGVRIDAIINDLAEKNVAKFWQ